MLKCFSVAILFLAGLSVQASAAETTIQWKNSEIPSEIRGRIEAAVKERCSISGYGLFEKSSKISEDFVDQGVLDIHYSVRLSTREGVDQYDYDEVDAVHVEVAHYAVVNPTAGDPIQIQSLTGLGRSTCR